MFLALGATPLLGTLVQQIRAMIPHGQERLPAGVYQAVRRQLADDRRTKAARHAFEQLEAPIADQFTAAPHEVLDPANVLYRHLELLTMLPRADAAAATSAPSDEQDAALAERLRSILRLSDPARLHAKYQRTVTLSSLRAHGVELRPAAAAAEYGFPWLEPPRRPVLRDVAGRLMVLGARWREAGRPRDALLAHATVVRLFDDIVRDSPVPDVALLAAEQLPPALRETGKDADAAGLPLSPDSKSDERTWTQQFAVQAQRVAALLHEWHRRIGPDDINLFPRTTGPLLAPAAHDAVLASMTASALVVGTWCTLALLASLLTAMAALRRQSDSPVWRWNGWGLIAAVAMVIAPMVGLIVLLFALDVPFTWLISLKSLPAMALAPFVVPVMVGLAARLGVQTDAAEVPTGTASRLIWVLAAVVVGSWVVLLLVPTASEPWQPPAGIQLFRRLGTWIGAECAVITAAWLTGALIQRRRSGVGSGQKARSLLGVVAWSLLATTLVGWVVLAINDRNDQAHAQVFAAAAADPLADRLGQDWQEAHFGGVRPLLNQVIP
ncbi:MAG: hypothetical protein AMXMBFR13_05950 [Phycisphaerae bacterium]